MASSTKRRAAPSRPTTPRRSPARRAPPGPRPQGPVPRPPPRRLPHCLEPPRRGSPGVALALRRPRRPRPLARRVGPPGGASYLAGSASVWPATPSPSCSASWRRRGPSPGGRSPPLRRALLVTTASSGLLHLARRDGRGFGLRRLAPGRRRPRRHGRAPLRAPAGPGRRPRPGRRRFLGLWSSSISRSARCGAGLRRARRPLAARGVRLGSAACPPSAPSRSRRRRPPTGNP